MTPDKIFPTLYKKTSTDAIQYWKIGVITREYLTNEYLYKEQPSQIVTEFGQEGTPNPQTTTDLISKGKNTGKKNQTTAYQQAVLEAEAKWEKQKKKGYVESIGAALTGQTDSIIEGGIVPMLAQKFSEHAHKIKYPAHTQPKLDGIRCVAILKDGTCTLWSRTRKRITSMPHIEAELLEVFGTHSATLDGELYNHDFRKDFEKIVSAVRKDKPEEGYLNVQYHIYDIVNDQTFSDRNRTLYTLFQLHQNMNGKHTPFKYLVRVETQQIENEDQLMDRFEDFVSEGYEGAMVRNSAGLYANKRSYDLQKVKEFEDAEFDIIGVEEGRGKLTGHAASFICKTPTGEKFNAKLKGDTATLKKYLENPSMWNGKKLTVKFQGYTNKNGVPRFPVGVAVRDYE